MMRTGMTQLVEDTLPARHSRGLSVALWIAQGLLAALFLLSGVMKFVVPVAQLTKHSSLSVSFLHFIGICEVLGGISLVLPTLFRIWPVLTPIAACGLVIIMAGATVLTIPMGWFAMFPLLVSVLTAFVAYGRFRLKPVQHK